MRLLRYSLCGGIIGVLLNISRIIQNWVLAYFYNNMALSWNYLQIRLKIQLKIFFVHFLLGSLCGLIVCLIKLWKERGKNGEE